MVGCVFSRFHLPLADSLLPAAFARPEAEQDEDDLVDVLDDLCTVHRYVLADRAELLGLGGEPAHRRGTGRRERPDRCRPAAHLSVQNSTISPELCLNLCTQLDPLS